MSKLSESNNFIKTREVIPVHASMIFLNVCQRYVDKNFKAKKELMVQRGDLGCNYLFDIVLVSLLFSLNLFHTFF